MPPHDPPSLFSAPSPAPPPPAAADDSEAIAVRPRRRGWIIGSAVVLLLFAAGVWIVWHLGSWLVVQDPLAPAHAIVVLSGRLPERAVEAARIYQQNVAAQIWVSQPVGPADELSAMHISYIGEDFYNAKVLMAQGVPPDAIHILEEPAANTEQEVDEIARDCRRDGAHAVIVVTSKPHTRRVRIIWQRRVGSDPRLIVRYVSDDSFEPTHWWRTTSDALDVVREWLGIANAWAGFPLQPQAK